VSGTGSGERDAEIVREALSHRSGYWEVHEALAALARIESEVARLEEAEVERDAALNEVARLTEERDHYRFHFDQQEERAEATEKVNRALGARNSELLAKLARLERIEEAALKAAREGAKWNSSKPFTETDAVQFHTTLILVIGFLEGSLPIALAAEEEGDRAS
jgi:hypothetical protein